MRATEVAVNAFLLVLLIGASVQRICEYTVIILANFEDYQPI